MSAVTPRDVLDAHATALNFALDEAVDAISESAPLLAASALARLSTQRAPEVIRDRLFAVAVLGSTRGSRGAPAEALPVSVLSALWWASTPVPEHVVDVTSSGHSTTQVWALPDGFATVALLSMRYLDGARIPQRTRWQWSQDVVRSTLAATEGRLVKNRRHSWEVSRGDAIANCLGRSGGAYARDALMAARVHAGEAAEEWRKFGMQYGLLHQLRGNRTEISIEHDADLANAVPTLLLAHAFALAKPARQAELVHLRLAAMHDLNARSILRELLHAETVVDSYRADIDGMHRQACRRLGSLCGNTEFRDVLRAELDTSARLAVPKVREVIGL